MRADYDELMEPGRIITNAEKNHMEEQQSAACRQVKVQQGKEHAQCMSSTGKGMHEFRQHAARHANSAADVGKEKES